MSVDKPSLSAVIACVMASFALTGVSAGTAFASSSDGGPIQIPERPHGDQTDIYTFGS